MGCVGGGFFVVATMMYKVDYAAATCTRFGVNKGGVGIAGIIRTNASTIGTVSLSSTSVTTVDGRCVR